MTIRLRVALVLLTSSLACSLVTQPKDAWASVQLKQAITKSHSAISQNKKESQRKRQVRPASFRDFADCVNWMKKSVYLIARGRQMQVDGKMFISWTTLGSGFLAAPYRLLTASHVINNSTKGTELALHRASDIYYLIRNDGDSFHGRSFVPELNKELFLYPDLDIAVIYLDERFYNADDPNVPTKDDYFRVDTSFGPIGSAVGILGYPLAKLEFENLDIARPRVGNIFLRAEAGVINTKYKTQQGSSVYEFTMMFNPGNSGGPIFDIKTGKVISLVEGFRSTPIVEEERVLTDDGAKNLKVYKEKAYISSIHATYSIGRATATPAIVELLKKHNVIK